MGGVRQAEEAISLYGGEPKPRMRQISRNLMDNGMIPRSAGRRIEPVNATETATMILAACVARKPADATRAALTWGRMTPGGMVIDWDDPARQQLVLAEVLTGCIKTVWQEGGTGPLTETLLKSGIEITTTRPHAIVDLGGQREEYLPVGGEREFPGFQRVIRIPGAAIRRIAMAIYEPHYNAILALSPTSRINPYRNPAEVLSHV